MRPERLEDFVGQQHILGPGKPLRVQIERDELQSLILWGPPGVGKTTLARLIARMTQARFRSLQRGAERDQGDQGRDGGCRAAAPRSGRRTVLFVDEIHRFNKAQQDAFLPYVERGDIILIGATTENPSFEVVSALLSRAKVYALRALTVEEIVTLLERALKVLELDGAARAAGADRDLFERRRSHGVQHSGTGVGGGAGRRDRAPRRSKRRSSARCCSTTRAGEEHFNLISALHKSVRSSDADAALYWLARMLEGGEDRMYIARRLVRMAIEDIGLADPRALEQAMAAQQAVHFLGVPEGDQALAQVAIYLAVAPKSDAAYRALNKAMETVANTTAEPVPMQLRNAPTQADEGVGLRRGLSARAQVRRRDEYDGMPARQSARDRVL